MAGGSVVESRIVEFQDGLMTFPKSSYRGPEAQEHETLDSRHPYSISIRFSLHGTAAEDDPSAAPTP